MRELRRCIVCRQVFPMTQESGFDRIAAEINGPFPHLCAQIGMAIAWKTLNGFIVENNKKSPTEFRRARIEQMWRFSYNNGKTPVSAEVLSIRSGSFRVVIGKTTISGKRRFSSGRGRSL